MRPADFIESCTGDIVQASMDFALTMPPLSGHHIDTDVLRDHLPLVLEAISHDLRQAQSSAEAVLKSQGSGHNRPLRQPRRLTVACVRTTASPSRNWSRNIGCCAPVTALWSQKHSQDIHFAQDLVRFNEAIDQALAESVAFHSAEVNRWRQTLLAVIGHDLRGPLHTISLTTQVLTGLAAEPRVAECADALTRSTRRMFELLDALPDYNKSLLGADMDIERCAVDLAAACEEELAILRRGLPGVAIEFEVSGDAGGDFDANRVREALANLVSNAAQYRRPGTPVRVKLACDPTGVVIPVANKGDAIDPQVLATLFEPLRRQATASSGKRRNLGLGLFIVREIAKAHGGEVNAVANGGDVVFSIHLPRHGPISKKVAR